MPCGGSPGSGRRRRSSAPRAGSATAARPSRRCRRPSASKAWMYCVMRSASWPPVSVVSPRNSSGLSLWRFSAPASRWPEWMGWRSSSSLMGLKTRTCYRFVLRRELVADPADDRRRLVGDREAARGHVDHRVDLRGDRVRTRPVGAVARLGDGADSVVLGDVAEGPVLGGFGPQRGERRSGATPPRLRSSSSHRCWRRPRPGTSRRPDRRCAATPHWSRAPASPRRGPRRTPLSR